MPTKTRQTKKPSNTSKSTKTKRSSAVVSGSAKRTGKWSWLAGRYGVLAFIVLFALVGVAYLTFSSAAAPQGLATFLPAGKMCVSATPSSGSLASVVPCQNATNQYWTMAGATIRYSGSSSVPYCLQASNASQRLSRVEVETCHILGAQIWYQPSWSGGVNSTTKAANGGTDLYNDQSFTSGLKECLVDNAGALEIVGCETVADLKNAAYQDQVWHGYTLPANPPTPIKPPTPSPAPPKPPAPPAKGGCLKTVVASGSSGTCTGAAQEMVNGMHVLNDYNVLHKSGYKNSFPGLSATTQYLAIDNSFGPATLTAVKDAQRMAGDGVDGAIGTETWSSLCRYNNPANGFIYTLVKGVITNTAVSNLHPTYAHQGTLGYSTACH